MRAPRLPTCLLPGFCYDEFFLSSPLIHIEITATNLGMIKNDQQVEPNSFLKGHFPCHPWVPLKMTSLPLNCHKHKWA